MTVTVDLSEEELSHLRRLTRTEDDSEAVASATREFIRLAHLKELKSVSGKVDYEDVSATLEEAELDEMNSLQ